MEDEPRRTWCLRDNRRNYIFIDADQLESDESIRMKIERRIKEDAHSDIGALTSGIIGIILDEAGTRYTQDIIFAGGERQVAFLTEAI